MNRIRLTRLIGLGASVLVIVLGWVLGIQPLLDTTDRLELERQSALDTNASTETLLASLEQAQADQEALQNSLAEINSAVPSDVDAARFIDEIAAVSGKSATTVRRLIWGEAVRYAVPAPDPSGAFLTPPAPLPFTDSRINAENFVAIPVTIETTGDYAGVLKFVELLQTSTRLFTVTDLLVKEEQVLEFSFAPPPVAGTITGYIFVLTDGTVPAA